MAPPIALPPTLGASVGYLLHRAFLHVQGASAETLAGMRHARDYALVAHLLAAGPRSQQDLAAAFRVNRSVMVGIVDSLEADGLVTRERNPADRRTYAVTPTAAAPAALERVAPRLLAAEEIAGARLSAAQRTRLRELLRALLGVDSPLVIAPFDRMTGSLIARSHLWLREMCERPCAPLALDMRELGLLTTVHDMAPCPQQRVAELLGVSGPVIVELVDTLEERSLVRRERNEADRRSYALQLSDAGETMLLAARERMAPVLHDVTERCGGRGAEAELAALLRRLIGAET